MRPEEEWGWRKKPIRPDLEEDRIILQRLGVIIEELREKGYSVYVPAYISGVAETVARLSQAFRQLTPEAREAFRSIETTDPAAFDKVLLGMLEPGWPDHDKNS